MSVTFSPLATLGPCCACGKEYPTVQNLLCLSYRAPVAGTGWGCARCGKAPDGALAVLCDACIKIIPLPLREIIHGFPRDKGRAPVPAEKRPFGHDLRRHPEAWVDQNRWRWFDDAPDAGPYCLCSVCLEPILASEGVFIRVCNADNLEARFHHACTPPSFGTLRWPEDDGEDDL